MNVQAIPVKLSSKERVTGTKAASEGKEDFISILRQRTESSRNTANVKEQMPVKKTDPKEEPKAKNKAKDTKEAETLGGQMSQETQTESGTSITDAADQAQKAASGTGEAVEKAGLEADSKAESDRLAAALMNSMAVKEQGNLRNPQNIQAQSSEVENGFMKMNAGKLQTQAEETGGKTAAEQLETLLNASVQNEQAPSTKGTAEAEVSSAAARLAGSQEKQPFDGNQGVKEAGMFKEAQMETLKNSSEAKGSENPNSDTGSSSQDGKELSKWFSLDHATRGEKHLETADTSQKQETASLEDLQKKAEQNAFLPFERLVGAKLSGGSMTQAVGNQGVTDATPLPDQLRAGIEQGLEKNLNQFTIRLKPEGLGEILVHLTSTGGKVSLSIGVSNLDTQKLLSSEMMHLKETLQPLNAEVQEIYHNSQSGMDMMSYEQGFYQNQQKFAAGTGHRHLAGGRAAEEEEDAELVQLAESVGRRMDYGRLSAYI